MKKMMMTAVLLGLGSFGVQAQAAKTEFNGGIGTWNPCNHLAVTVTGPVNLQVQTVENKNNVNVAIEGRVKLDGADSQSNPYKLSMMFNATFNAKSNQYIVPYTAIFVGQGGAPNFKLDGDVKVYVDNAGKPVGVVIVSGSSSCQQ